MDYLKETAPSRIGRSRYVVLRTLARSAAALMVLAAGVRTPRAAAYDAPPSNVVYVESNDPNGNAIFAFKRHADGSLTPLPGSPFPTGGTGITPTFNLGPFDSDQEIISNPSHTLLFAVNGGSDTIAVFKIASNGSLTPVAGSPFFSGGSNPVSVGLAGDVLCVVNKDEDPDHPGTFLPNYTTFLVKASGQLVPIPGSTVLEENGADPSQAFVAPGGKLLFGADFLGGALRSFAISPSGRLIPRELQPLPPAQFADTGAGAFPLGLAAHPTRPILYVGFVTISRVGVYRYNSAGALQFLLSVPNSGHGVCWLRVNKEGTRLYASNTGDPSITVYDISRDPSEPLEIQKVNLNSVPGSNPGGFQIELDPTGSFLHVVTQQSAANSTVAANAVHVFEVAPEGTISEVASSPTVLPVPNLTRPQGLVAF
jgi:6-phosphogluconolactonase (cycloisomerase 2 family)